MDHRCAHCKRSFFPNPRVKDQQYCGRPVCQRARNTRWQRNTMKTDPDYQANQRDSQKKWRSQHPDYWRHYRNRRPGYCERNRLMQRQRDARRRVKNLAKMDALKTNKSVNPDTYYLVPYLANKDALPQKIILIPACSPHISSACKQGLDRLDNFSAVGDIQKGGSP